MMFFSRISLSSLVLFFYCIVVRGQIKGYGSPQECNAVDCPKYSVIHSQKEFEIRSYSQALWTTYKPVVDSSIMGAIGKGSDELILYYFRRNDQKVNIVDSGPTLMIDILNSTYTDYYSVPYKYQDGGLPLPKPFNPKIKQVKLPKHKYAVVRRVSRIWSDQVVAEELDALRRSLRGSAAYQRAADRDQYSFILYDAGVFGDGCEVLIWFD